MTGHSLIANQALTNESKPSRRTLIGGALAAVLLSALAPAGRVMAQGMAQPNDPFILLLKGLYQPVVPGEDLGLSSVDVDDGSYVKTHIYPVYCSGITSRLRARVVRDHAEEEVRDGLG